MSKLLFKMRDVPEDEAQEVRELLTNGDIEFFETFAGNWGISLPALWLQKNEQFELARQLLDEYQIERSQRVHDEYQIEREKDGARTMWQSFIESPLRFGACLFSIGLVLYFSTRFFLSF